MKEGGGASGLLTTGVVKCLGRRRSPYDFDLGEKEKKVIKVTTDGASNGTVFTRRALPVGVRHFARSAKCLGRRAKP